MNNEDVTELKNVRFNQILNNKTKTRKNKATEGMKRKNESSTHNDEKLSEYFGEKSTSNDENSTAGAKFAQNVIALLQIATKNTEENNSEFEQEEGREKDAERQGIVPYNIWKEIRAFPKPEVRSSVSLRETTRSGNGDKKMSKEIGTP